MANTRYLRTVVEAYVRKVLSERFGQSFEPRFLSLQPGGRHEFDAVSLDEAVVASVKAASGLTAGGRVPSGKIKDSLAEVYFLSLVDARVRMLVLTTPSFHQIFTRMTAGQIADGVTVECIPLPSEMQDEVDRIVRSASEEVSPTRARTAIAAEIETND